MFCEQCEQTASGEGCHQWGACGKSPQLNAVQDLLVYTLRGLAPVALKARELGIPIHEVDVFTGEALFATMTNVNFDPKRFRRYIQQAIAHRETLKAQIHQAMETPPTWSALSSYTPDFNASLVEQGLDVGLNFIGQSGTDIDTFSLKLTVLYGIKGTASYAFHAQELGQGDAQVYRFCHEALAALDQQDLSLDDWVGLALKVGATNLRAMELLDAGHTGTYGHPTPTTVPPPRQTRQSHSGLGP